GIPDALIARALQGSSAARNHALRAHPELLSPGVPEQAAGGLVDVHEAHACAVDQDDHVGRFVHRQPETAQLFLCGALLGNVPHYGDDDVASLRMYGAAEYFDRKPGAVLAAVPASHRGVALAAFDQAAVDPRELFAGDGDDVLRVHAQQLLAGVAQLPAHGVVDVDELDADRVREPYHVLGHVHGRAE